MLGLLLGALAVAPASAQPAGSSGVISVTSERSVAETRDELVERLETSGLRITTVIDFSESSAAVGEPLPPTTAIWFEQPDIAASLVAEEPVVGVDLPLKVLVAEEPGGEVRISFNDSTYYTERHGLDALPELERVAEMMTGLIDGLTPQAEIELGDRDPALDASPAPEPTETRETLAFTGLFAPDLLPVGLVAVLAGAAVTALAALTRHHSGLEAAAMACCVVVVVALALSPDAAEAQRGAGVVSVRSEHSIDETLERIRSVAPTVDATVDLTIVQVTTDSRSSSEPQPVVLVTLATPAANAVLLRDSPTIGLDLPHKLLVWGSADEVWISYNDPHWIADRHELSGNRHIVDELSATLGLIAEAGRIVTTADPEVLEQAHVDGSGSGSRGESKAAWRLIALAVGALAASLGAIAVGTSDDHEPTETLATASPLVSGAPSVSSRSPRVGGALVASADSSEEASGNENDVADEPVDKPDLFDTSIPTFAGSEESSTDTSQPTRSGEQTRATISASYAPPPLGGGEYSIDVTVANVGKRRIVFTDASFTLTTARGSALPLVGGDFGEVVLEPGASRWGTLVFEVPAGSSELQLTFHIASLGPVRLAL